MIELPDLESLNPIVEWDAFIFDVLIPICLDHGWHVDFDSIEDQCCLIYSHFSRRSSQDWQRFISDFVKPFCEERGWTVEIMPKEGETILIHVPNPVKPKSDTNFKQLDFFDICSPTPKRVEGRLLSQKSLLSECNKEI